MEPKIWTIISTIQSYMLLYKATPCLHIEFLRRITKQQDNPTFVQDLALAWAIMFGADPANC